MFLKQILIGLIIGGGMIIPGVSGGVLAVILGVYELALDAVANFFKDIKKNSFFLSSLVIGIIIGIFIFGKILFFVFDQYPMEAKYTFIGLILGNIPVLFKEIEKRGRGKINWLLLMLAFLIASILFVLGGDTLNINFSNRINGDFISFLLLLLTGFIFVGGKIIPGISSSFMLMLIGMYQFLLNILNNPFALSKEQYFQIVPFTLGIIIGAIFFVKIIRYLLKKYFSHTYSVIIGFVIGSIAAIYPGFNFDYESFLGLTLFAISFLISYNFAIRDYKRSKNK